MFLGMICMTFAASVEGKQVNITWTRETDIPLPRGGYFAAWHNGGLWLAGGSYWKDGKKLWTDEASFYNPKTKAWSSLQPLPKAFGYGATANVGKDLYLFGGTDADGNLNKAIYRLRDGNWSEIGESPAGFIYPAYAAIGKRVYIFGGSTVRAMLQKPQMIPGFTTRKSMNGKNQHRFRARRVRLFRRPQSVRAFIFSAVSRRKPARNFTI
jgi:hypothetical protein